MLARLILAVVLLTFASVASAQPADTPTVTSTATPTSTPTLTPTSTYAAPPTPHCSGPKLGGVARFVDRTIANTTEVALIEPTSSSKAIVLTQLCASVAGATIVTFTYEQPYHATTLKMDFAGAGSQCMDVNGKCLPDGIDLLVKQTGSVSTQLTVSYVEQ